MELGIDRRRGLSQPRSTPQGDMILSMGAQTAEEGQASGVLAKWSIHMGKDSPLHHTREISSQITVFNMKSKTMKLLEANLKI